MANLVQHRTKRPRVDQAMVGQLDEWKRVDLRPEPPQRDTAPKGGRREAGAHIGKRRRRWHRAGDRQAHIGLLIAVKRDPIATEQPASKARLALAEQLKVKVPD